jgi:hypothetical protein
MATKTNEDQLELGYQPLEAVASRDESRSLAKGRGREIYIADIYDIELRPGMNWRKKPSWLSQEDWEKEKLGIPELAAAIYANNGPADPLQADHPKGLDKFQLTDGQRRMYAILYIVTVMEKLAYPNGKEVRKVELLLNQKEATDLERSKSNYTTQNKMPLSPLEIGQGFKDMQDRYKMSHDAIAKHFGNMSRQFVTNMIALTELPVSVQIDIYNGVVPYSNALAAARKEKAHKKPEHANTNDNSDHDRNDDVDTALETNKLERKDGQSQTIQVQENESEQEEKTIPDQTLVDKDGDNTDVPNTSAHEPPAIIETNEAHDAEWKSRQTDGNFKEQRPSKDRQDALPQQDYRNDKQQAEFNMNDVIGFLDKMEVMLNKIPELGGMKKDLLGFNGFIRKKVMETKELIKKAPDRGAE